MGLPDVRHRTISAVYQRVLERIPDEITQLGPDGRYTVVETYARSLRIAGGFTELGVSRAAGIVLRRADR